MSDSELPRRFYGVSRDYFDHRTAQIKTIGDEVLVLVSVISNKISSWEKHIELIRYVQMAEMASLRMFQKWKILDHIPGEAGWDEQAVVDCECGHQHY